jgi:hypothetical protein
MSSMCDTRLRVCEFHCSSLLMISSEFEDGVLHKIIEDVGLVFLLFISVLLIYNVLMKPCSH